MRKALISFGTGDAARTLAVARPTFEDYAERHGYDLLTEAPDFGSRPPSWWKVPLLRESLRRYDFVLWIDADAIIVDSTVDIEAEVPGRAFQAFVVMNCGAGPTPCLGVWALRSSARAERFLDALWEQNDLTGHKWWEQAAAMRLLGWTIDPPLVKERTTEWDAGSFELAPEWDVIPKFAGTYRARIRHYGADTTRRRLIEMRTDLAEVRSHRLRYGVGVLERRARPVYRRVAAGFRSPVASV